MILYLMFSRKMLVMIITGDSLDHFSFLQKLHRANMNCDTCELFMWLFRLKHCREWKKYLTHTQKIVHINTLSGSLNYSSVRNRKSIHHTHRKSSSSDIELSESFTNEAGFNLLYMFPEAASEPDNRKPDLQTSPQKLFSFLTSQAGFTLSQIVLEGSSETDNSRALSDIVEVC